MAENKNRLRVSETPVVKNDVKEPKKNKEKATKPKAPKKPENKVAKRRKESDGRVRMCFGIFFFLVSVFLLIAFASPYLGYSPKGLWLNNLGKFMSEEMFGIGTAYIIFLIGLLGLNLMWKKIHVKSWTLWKYSLVFLIWVPVFLALIFRVLPENEISQYEIYFGLVGHKCFTFLQNYIGLAGVILILIFTALIYIIFTFDIKFDFLKKKDEENVDEPADEPSDAPISSDFPKVSIVEKPTEIDLTDGFDDIEDESDEDIDITIKKHDDFIEDEPSETSGKTDDVEMEIAEQAEEKQVKENGEHFGIDTTYDPKLELSDFKLPQIGRAHV